MFLWRIIITRKLSVNYHQIPQCLFHCSAADRSENSDTTPVVVRIRQQEEHLPDFGGQSPIRREEEEEEKRPHGKLTRF